MIVLPAVGVLSRACYLLRFTVNFSISLIRHYTPHVIPVHAAIHTDLDYAVHTRGIRATAAWTIVELVTNSIRAYPALHFMPTEVDLT